VVLSGVVVEVICGAMIPINKITSGRCERHGFMRFARMLRQSPAGYKGIFHCARARLKMSVRLPA